MVEIRQSEVNSQLVGRFEESDVKYASEFSKDLANHTQMMIRVVSCGDCQQCPAANRNQFALPVGSVRPKVVVVFDQPDDYDVKTHTIGFGERGRAILSILSKIDLKDSEVYLTSVAKCKHEDVDETSRHCVKTCFREELKRLKPQTIIAVGECASDHVRATLGVVTKSFDDIRGKGTRLPDSSEFPSVKLLSIQSMEDLLQRKGSGFSADRLRLWQELKTIILA